MNGNQPFDPGQESLEDALIAIGSEPDPNVRWSMLVHRGKPSALTKALWDSGVKLAPWNAQNELYPWAVAMLQHPEYMAESKALFVESEKRAHAFETARAKNIRRDLHSSQHWAHWHQWREKLQAEGWTPDPAKTRTMASMIDDLVMKAKPETKEHLK